MASNLTQILEARILPKIEHDVLEDCRCEDARTLSHHNGALDGIIREQIFTVVKRQQTTIQSNVGMLQDRIAHRKGHYA